MPFLKYDKTPAKACGKMKSPLAALVLLLVVRLAGAAPPLLGLPIDCRLGVDCHIQNFYDHDPGPGWRDYACGSLAYDGHTGTDFRLADRAAMAAGVNVLAAAAGIVAAVRDGEPDISVNRRGRSALGGKDAGNAVRIEHGDGWETQYSHLKRGSIAVRAGQHVEAGTVLGQVGLSGNTEFPHVDFTVRRQGRPVDPFAPDAGACGETRQALWDPALAKTLSYRPSGLLIAGFAPSVPERDSAEAGGYAAPALAADSPAIVFWMELFGLRKDDVLEMSLGNADGRPLATSRTIAERDKAVWFGVVGKRRGTAAWPAGNYVGRVILRRSNAVIIDAERTISLR